MLTGPESLSQRAQIETIGRVIGRAVPIEEMPADEARRTGIAGMPPAVAGKLLDAWAAGLGQPAVVTTAVREVTRVDARRFDAWVAANA